MHSHPKRPIQYGLFLCPVCRHHHRVHGGPDHGQSSRLNIIAKILHQALQKGKTGVSLCRC